MRGTPAAAQAANAAQGIIPAHAGNTRSKRPARASAEDHPRTCGEHSRMIDSGYAKEGSSPHMRGTRKARSWQHEHDGIIPAHAGNTFSTGDVWRVDGDHPRTCGEHPAFQWSPNWLPGSSPHMRGTHGDSTSGPLADGIIPAHAGNTLARLTWEYAPSGSSPHMRGTPPARSRRVRLRRDHPRTCGEHGTSTASSSAVMGSSPHMRGTPRDNPRPSPF